MINRREFVLTGAAAGLAAAAQAQTPQRPGSSSQTGQGQPSQAPAVVTRRGGRPIVISSSNGYRYRNGGTQTCVERAFGSFSRSLSLPRGIDPDGVTAEFTDGVLEVRIPKPEEQKPHRVEIGAGSVNGKATEK